MTVHIIESRLAELLDRGILARGGHSAYSGHRCANEWVAYIAGEPHTAAPACVSPVLRRYTMTLNDRWDDAQRQLLKPYLPRMLGTQGDGLDGVRINLARQAIVTDLLPAWLRLAGMDAEAAALAASTPGDLYRVLRDVRDAAWARRQVAYASVRAAAVHAKLAGRPAAAAVAAAAAAAAVAAAVAAAAAEAEAGAVAAAAAAAVAAAVAGVAAGAAAGAAAAAAAAADAAAVAGVAAGAEAEAEAEAAAGAAAGAAAAAAAEAAPVAGDYWTSYDAAFAAARPIFEEAIAESTAPKMVAIRELAAAQRGAALDLLDRMIRPEVA